MLVGAALVAACFVFVDRPVAFFVYHQRFSDMAVLKWLTYPPPILQAWTPAALAALMVRRAWGPFCRWELAILTASVSMVVADQFRESLAYVFGRYWPETWIDSNPSLIQNGAYGFHPFHGGSAYGSFPSGHATRTFALTSIIWSTYPRWRGVAAMASAAVAVGLLGMNYHFVSDVIAGSFLGSIVSRYAAQLSGLAQAPPSCAAHSPN